MSLELKSISTNARLSEETICYSAKLYWKGAYIADVGNRGCGGPDEVHVRPGMADAFVEANEFVATLPDVPSGFKDLPSLKMDLELWCGITVGDYMQKKEIASMFRRDLKKAVVYLINGACFTVTFKNAKTLDARHFEHVRNKHPGAVILNEMPEAEALKLYAEAVVQKAA